MILFIMIILIFNHFNCFNNFNYSNSNIQLLKHDLLLQRSVINWQNFHYTLILSSVEVSIRSSLLFYFCSRRFLTAWAIVCLKKILAQGFFGLRSQTYLLSHTLKQSPMLVIWSTLRQTSKNLDTPNRQEST